MIWLTVNDYADMKGITKQAVEKQITKKKIPKSRVQYKEVYLHGNRSVKHISVEESEIPEGYEIPNHAKHKK